MNFWLNIRYNMLGGYYPHITRACDFIDQATAQWNCALVRNWYASHVANSIIQKQLTPRFGSAVNPIRPYESVRSLYCQPILLASLYWMLILEASELWDTVLKCGLTYGNLNPPSKCLFSFGKYSMIVFWWEESLQQRI